MMTPIPLFISIQQALLVLAVLLCTVFTIRLYAPNRALIVVLRIWLVVTAFAGWNGFLSDTQAMPPRFVFFMAPQLIAILYYVFVSRRGRQLLQIPQWILIGLQSFRIGVEVILAELAGQGLFPHELTFRGLNFDIVSGVLGLLLGLAIRKKGEARLRGVIAAYNLVGLGFLFNIVIHAALAIPGPLQQFHYPIDNWVMTMFPMQWLPLFLVPVALSLHLISLRKLSRAPASPS